MPEGGAADVKLMDYQEWRTVSNTSELGPRALAVTASRVDAKCPPSAPVLCKSGTCAISSGKCALLAQGEGGVWSSHEYVESNLALGVNVSVTSNSAGAAKLVDENSQTFWQSGQCYPTGSTDPCSV